LPAPSAAAAACNASPTSVAPALDVTFPANPSAPATVSVASRRVWWLLGVMLLSQLLHVSQGGCFDSRKSRPYVVRWLIGAGAMSVAPERRIRIVSIKCILELVDQVRLEGFLSFFSLLFFFLYPEFLEAGQWLAGVEG
jgi:hypothetical protein